ncbi:hypothetical protein BGZ49_002054 [Haplosporangium sp. Z 27]|nr:hypothetical protein BGZ49_002054 [Haplosporangium sp. Z 27]
MANILDNSSSDNSNTNQWLASLDATGISTTTANNNNNNNNIPASFIDTKPPSIHSRPHRENDSLRTDNDIPPLQDYNNLNNNDNNNTSTDSSGNPTIGGDIGSRADVFAGVIIFSTGMLVLIAAMIFYFVNGRSWRSAKRRQQQHTEESSALEKGIELDNDNEDHNDDNNNNNTLQEKKEEHYSDEDISTTCVMNDNDHDNDYIQQSFNSSNNNSNVDSKELEVPLSPSTAPLADVPTKSVFSFLKGTQRNPSISSTISDSNTDDPLASTMIMPALTRTKARSSVKSKSDSNMSQQQQQQKPRSINAEEILQNHVAIDMIQEPEFYNSNNNSNNSTNNNNSNDNNDDNDSTTCSDSTGALYLSRKNHTTLSSPSSSSSSRAHMHRSSRNSTVPTLLRLDMPPQTNPSIIGLYGSAKSSPNGSLADAASVQAIYSHSLRSVMSFATHADSTSAMDCPDTESKEVVLASADMKLERD